MIFKDLEKIVFIGDSVTDAGRKRPIGEGLWEGTGNGFVRMVENFLNVCYPQRVIEVVNMGVAGNTSLDLINRFDRDCIALVPNYAVICIGFNDVWRFFDEPSVRDGQVAIEVYQENLIKMVKMCHEANIKVIFISPYYLELNKKDLMRIKMDEYREAMKQISSELNVDYVDLQKPFDAILQYRYPAYISWDRVHPNHIGSLVIAKTFLKHVGFDFNLLNAD